MYFYNFLISNSITKIELDIKALNLIFLTGIKIIILLLMVCVVFTNIQKSGFGFTLALLTLLMNEINDIISIFYK